MPKTTITTFVEHDTIDKLNQKVKELNLRSRSELVSMIIADFLSENNTEIGSKATLGTVKTARVSKRVYRKT